MLIKGEYMRWPKKLLGLVWAVFVTFNFLYAGEIVELPPAYGKVSSTYVGDPGKVVFLIKDYHTISELQVNISNILDYLAEYGQISAVLTEGMYGRIDTGKIGKYYDKDALKNISLFYMLRAFYGGATYYKLNRGNNLIPLIGIDSVKAYGEHYKKYKDTYHEREESLRQVRKLKEIFNKFKDKTFSHEMLNIYKLESDYKKNIITLYDYVSSLILMAHKFSILISSYPNIQIIYELDKLSVKEDSEKLAVEVNAVIDKINEGLSGNINEKAAFLTYVKHYREGTVSEAKFFKYLYDFAVSHSVDIGIFKAFMSKVKYYNLMNNIDNVELKKETDELIYLLQKAVLREYPSEIAEKIIEYSKRLDLLERVFSLKVSKREFNNFIREREKYLSSEFISFIRENALRCDVGYRIDPNVVKMDKMDGLLRDIYAIADKRSKIMADNIIEYLNKNGNAACVAGSYHIEEIESYLKEKGVSYIVITPYISRFYEDIDIEYALLNEKVPILAFLRKTYAILPWNKFYVNLTTEPSGLKELMKIELVAESFFSGLEGTAKKDVSKRIGYVNSKVKGTYFDNISIKGLLLVKDAENKFLHLKFGDSMEFLIAPVGERKEIEAFEQTKLYDFLSFNQLAAGIYKCDDSFISKLCKECSAEYMPYDNSIVFDSDGTGSDGGEHGLSLFDTALRPDYASLYENEKEAVKKYLSEIRRLENLAHGSDDIEFLNDILNRFALIKSRLVLYQIVSDKDKKYISDVEKLINSKLAGAVKRAEDTEKDRKREMALSVKRKEAERKLKEKLLMEKKRKEINEIISKIVKLKNDIKNAESILDMGKIEEEFNKLIGKLSLGDLTEKDRRYLNEYKVAWEAKYSILVEAKHEKENRYLLLKNLTGEGGRRVLSSEEIALLKAYMQKAITLKEFAAYALLSSDVETVLEQYDEMKKEKYFDMLSAEEKILFIKIGSYIKNILEEKRSGKIYKDGGIAVVVENKPIPRGFAENFEFDLSNVDTFMRGIYKIRSRLLEIGDEKNLSILINKINNVYEEAEKKFRLGAYEKETIENLIKDISQKLDSIKKYKESLRKEKMSRKEEKERKEKKRLLHELLNYSNGTALPAAPQQKAILFIEDNRVERDVVAKKLMAEGYDVETYDSYDFDFSVIFDDDKISLILLDDDIISEKTGIDFVTEVKNIEKKKMVRIPPIVIHTNSSVGWLYERLKKRGITKQEDVYILSKHDLDKNIKAINNLLRVTDKK